MVLAEASAAVADDEPSDVQRFWKSVVKLPAPLAVDGMLLELAFNASVSLEDIDATFLYCCTCCDPFSGCGSGVRGVLFVAAASSEPDAEISPSCASAPAIAEASWFALAVEELAEAMRAAAGDSSSSFL